MGGDLAAHGLLRRHVGHGAHHHSLFGQTGTVQGHRQPEIADLGDAIGGDPNVSRFQIAVDDAPAVGKLQTPAGLSGDADRLCQGKTVALGILYQTFHVAAAHQLGDHVRLVPLLAEIENSDDMGVGAQSAHSLGFPLYTLAGGIVQALGLDQGKGHLPVQEGVLGQVDLLFATLAQETFDLIAAIGKGDRQAAGRLY